MPKLRSFGHALVKICARLRPSPVITPPISCKTKAVVCMRDKDLHPALSPRHKMSHFHETETYFSQFLLYIRKRDILSFIHIKSCSLYIKPSLQVVVFVVGANDIGTKTPVRVFDDIVALCEGVHDL